MTFPVNSGPSPDWFQALAETARAALVPAGASGLWPRPWNFHEVSFDPMGCQERLSPLTRICVVRDKEKTCATCKIKQRSSSWHRLSPHRVQCPNCFDDPVRRQEGLAMAASKRHHPKTLEARTCDEDSRRKRIHQNEPATANVEAHTEIPIDESALLDAPLHTPLSPLSAPENFLNGVSPSTKR